MDHAKGGKGKDLSDQLGYLPFPQFSLPLLLTMLVHFANNREDSRCFAESLVSASSATQYNSSPDGSSIRILIMR